MSSFATNGFYIIYKTIKPVHELYLQPSFVEVSSQFAEVSSFYLEVDSFYKKVAIF